MSMDTRTINKVLSRFIRLTPKQQLVARAAGRGYSEKEMAQLFGNQLNTVKRHLTDIYNALGVENRLHLAIAMHWMILREEYDADPNSVPPVKRLSSIVTPRQLKVALLIAEGCDAATMAAVLGLSTNTIGKHSRHLYLILGYSNRVEVAQRVIHEQFLDSLARTK